jgi:uncharacterized protein DUF2752
MTESVCSVFGRKAFLFAGVAGAIGCAILFCFDPTQHHFYPTCIFHQTTGLLCPGCGSLRALHQLLHGHFITAFRFNPLLVLALPSLAGLGVIYKVKEQSPELQIQSFRPQWLWAMGIIFLAFSIWRNLPGAPALITPP